MPRRHLPDHCRVARFAAGVEEDVSHIESGFVLVAVELDVGQLGSRCSTLKRQVERVAVQIASQILFDVHGTDHDGLETQEPTRLHLLQAAHGAALVG